MQRNTVQRTLILDAVRSVRTHPTADEIYNMVSGRCPGISRGTVYRVLGNLAVEGEILRIPVADAPDRFDLTVQPHAHGKCDCCGRVFDINLENYPTEGKNPDFIVASISVIASGRCRSCAGTDIP